MVVELGRGGAHGLLVFLWKERKEGDMRPEGEGKKKGETGKERAALRVLVLVGSGDGRSRGAAWLVASIAGGRSGLGSRTSSSLEAGKDGGA